jgi:hypothetical protein
MNDWQLVTEAEPWLVRSPETASVRPLDLPFEPNRQFRSRFPELNELLCRARMSEITLPKGTHLLFAWGDIDRGIRAWLSPVAPKIVSSKAAPDHQLMLECFGGIVDRFNEPSDNWLMNHNEALVASEVERDASFMTSYSWAFEECGGIPIDMSAYYPAAWEANGNCVLCSRENGQLLFFAPDHCDEDLIPYDSCPMFTLHTKRYASSFQEWVETIAVQWLNAIATSSD